MKSAKPEVLYGLCEYKRHATDDDRRGPLIRCSGCKGKFCRRHIAVDTDLCLDCNLPAASRANLDKPKTCRITDDVKGD